FRLFSFADARGRARQIAEATRSRYMPPWLAEPGHGDFANSRRLDDDQLGLLQQWIEEGCREGNAAELPPPPEWNDEWALGRPDLIVTLPRPYALAADGRDVYRSFVLPVPLTTGRYVRAVELQPGNRRILHHALIKVDRTPQSRQLDAQSDEPGFVGMNTAAEMPGGHFLTWQPGRVATPLPPGLGFRLEPGNDIVLQTHLNPSGKPESFQPALGLYFTEHSPTNVCFKMSLTSFLIDIPAGRREYPVAGSFTLPADVDLLAVLPHAHYLARDVQGWAILPDGTKQWLVWIKRWDFNWQSDYRYVTPMFLPKGSALHMRFTFDNSADNERNPFHPPRRVRYGPQSQDEMAELWLQLLPRRESDRPLLAEAYRLSLDRTFAEADEYNLRLDPNDAKAHIDLGLRLSSAGESAKAIEHLLTASGLQPANDEPRYLLGTVLRRQGKPEQARLEFEAALLLNPNNSKAHGNLGFLDESQGRFDEAEAHYRAALKVNPGDSLAQASLEQLLRARGRGPGTP
ncbi:MAG TPA: tetratricopeptide repeat protein, partial [Gemmatimonadales bacterium]|nr:tetratricopeptide repeat protein [Gemmatimonadales bacterium]